MARSDSWILKATATAATALALVAAGTIPGCSGDKETEEAENWGDILGDWTPYSFSESYNGVLEGKIVYYNNPDEKKIISFRPSGMASECGFHKVGDAWVEFPFGSVNMLLWRTEGPTIYGRERYYNDQGEYVEEEEEAIGTYVVSGNRLILTSCHYIDYYDGPTGSTNRVNHCNEITYTWVNANDIRQSLNGPIYQYNPALRGSWILQDGNNDNNYLTLISFGTTYVSGYGVERYVAKRYEGEYYTYGDKLYLVTRENCYTYSDPDLGPIEQCPAPQTITLPYGISDSGTLTINNDVWKIKQENYHSQTKSKLFHINIQ